MTGRDSFGTMRWLPETPSILFAGCRLLSVLPAKNAACRLTQVIDDAERALSAMPYFATSNSSPFSFRHRLRPAPPAHLIFPPTTLHPRRS